MVTKNCNICEGKHNPGKLLYEDDSAWAYDAPYKGEPCTLVLAKKHITQNVNVRHSKAQINELFRVQDFVSKMINKRFKKAKIALLRPRKGLDHFQFNIVKSA